MADLDAPLPAVVPDRYRIERELGRGGMATVYLARDLRHDRQVALKVLHPELASSLAAERFVREIEIAASLNHPNILPLLDSGAAGKRDSGEVLLWYVMPVMEGESLRDRLGRETQLPLDEALQIARQVADALTHAHSRGIVHRDIKPGNILLSGGHAIVADFGIARALDSAGGSHLTETGLTIGTAAYMSPEQSAADPRMDGRTDIYALGCVVYEMLSGHPPFSGRSAQALAARHLMDPVPSIRTVRKSVPRRIERALEKALEKSPADRFRTATQFSEALTTGTAPRLGNLLPRPALISLAIGLVILLAVLAFAQLSGSRASKRGLDPNLVAIFPFRVSSAGPELAYLREGMLDLMDASFTGEGGLRAADVRSVLQAWQGAGGSVTHDVEESKTLRLARDLNASQAVFGSLVGTPSRLELSASLLDVATGQVKTRANAVGPQDSLSHLVARLTGALLLGTSGEAQELASIVPLPALQAYLAGQGFYRRGRWGDAMRSYGKALEIDSTFSLAALGYAEVAGWSEFHDPSREVGLAWAGRDRLNRRDRAFLTASLGPRFPAMWTQREILDARIQYVELARDRAAAWYMLGSHYFNVGAFLGLEDWRERASHSLRRALELDSTFSPALNVLIELAGLQGDMASVHSLTTQYLAIDSLGDRNGFRRWYAAMMLGDSAALQVERAAFDRMPSKTMQDITYQYLHHGFASEDRRLAVTAFQRRTALSEGERDRLGGLMALSAHSEGRPSDALAALRRMNVLDRSQWLQRTIIRNALYWDGDSTAARQAAREVAWSARGSLASDPMVRERQLSNACVLSQWRLAHHDTTAVVSMIGFLRSGTASEMAPGVKPEDTPENAYPWFCASLLEAWLAVETERPDRARLVAELDSLLRTGPLIVMELAYANLVTASLLERLGDRQRALAALRRRGAPYSSGGHEYLSTYAREEGRLAAELGDRTGAIEAYEFYLRLRRDPETSLHPQVDSVRAELGRLLEEPR